MTSATAYFPVLEAEARQAGFRQLQCEHFSLADGRFSGPELWMWAQMWPRIKRQMCNNCSRETKEQRRNCHWDPLYQKKNWHNTTEKGSRSNNFKLWGFAWLYVWFLSSCYWSLWALWTFPNFLFGQKKCQTETSGVFLCFGFGFCDCGDLSTCPVIILTLHVADAAPIQSSVHLKLCSFVASKCFDWWWFIYMSPITH